MPAPIPDAIVITGATASGKSGLALDVSERLAGEIISADSRQVYRCMDIGTAKPAAPERSRVRHYGIDCLDPEESYSAGRFARDAWRWMDEIRGRGHVPVIVGGTGFFVRALLSPLGPEPELDPERRARLRRYLMRQPTGQLKRWLERLDPKRAEVLQGEGGAQRLARSLEVVLLSGRGHSWWLDRPPETPTLSAAVFCLQLPREELFRRIEGRFELMMADGLLDEVRMLLERYGADFPGVKSVGYAELVACLRGERTLEEAVEEAKRNARRFARRQLTWFRHQLPEDTIRLDASRPRDEVVREVCRIWGERTGRAGSETSSAIAWVD